MGLCYSSGEGKSKIAWPDKIAWPENVAKMGTRSVRVVWFGELRLVVAF